MISICCSCVLQPPLPMLAKQHHGAPVRAVTPPNMAELQEANCTLGLPCLKQQAEKAGWVPPAAWLQRLVNRPQLTGPSELSALMAASWDMCEAVLRVAKRRWFVLEVSCRAVQRCPVLAFALCPLSLVVSQLVRVGGCGWGGGGGAQHQHCFLHTLAAQRRLPQQPASLVAQSCDGRARFKAQV